MFFDENFLVPFPLFKNFFSLFQRKENHKKFVKVGEAIVGRSSFNPFSQDERGGKKQIRVGFSNVENDIIHFFMNKIFNALFKTVKIFRGRV